jgi:D-cysteine desulfhydrase family pyridoxal phosphate-dependent enzyme
MVLSDLPKFALAHLPTPLEPLERLRAELAKTLPAVPQLYIKRDDCTGLALGGNKTRKLEFLIGEALANRATAVVSEGGLQSNHVRQTAAAAARAGLACHLVLNHTVPITTEIYRNNGNLLLDRLLGAVIHRCEAGETRAARSARVIEELRAKGEAPYYIPLGGSNATGALGYAAAALELLRQAKERGLAIDHVAVASSSGGTQAGLILGMAMAGADVPVLGVDIDHDPEHALALVREITRAAADKVALRRAISSSAFQLARGYAAPGYGQPNPGMVEAVQLLARLEGIVLDPVYTGKAMAGLIDLVRKGTFGANETVVFIHTGGAPGLFAYENHF